MKKQKAVVYIIFGASLFLMAVLGTQYVRQGMLQRGIAEKILRFHVLANSDSAEDQRLKEKVRDAVGEQMGKLLAGTESREQAEQIVLEEKNVILETAAKTIADEGYAYPVEAYLREADFPVKEYGDYVFPAGRYRALQIVIGAGEGHNWWCVVYPNLCFSGSVYEIKEEEAEEVLREVLSEKEYEKIFASGDYELRFRLLELFGIK
ncbi:MAG: stage II sporulation protein R [Roseburia sp.]